MSGSSFLGDAFRTAPGSLSDLEKPSKTEPKWRPRDDMDRFSETKAFYYRFVPLFDVFSNARTLRSYVFFIVELHVAVFGGERETKTKM